MDCLFCKIVNKDIPSYNIYENDYVMCFLDINPQNTGHTLIIPKKHIKDIYDIDEKYLIEINKASKKIIELLDSTLKPNGYQLVQNNGNKQDIKHYHLHIIPSYIKNQNLSVEEVYNKIKSNC